ncbi:MAG: hypothetical protein HPKKFMNG_01442 [Planctomycetes bacterium]|nr:hypothetical protein [Planctomycetota bacterium]
MPPFAASWRRVSPLGWNVAIEIQTLLHNPARPITALDLSPDGDKLALALPGLRGAAGALALFHTRRNEVVVESASLSHAGVFGARFGRGGRTVIYGATDSRGIYEFDTLNHGRRRLELEVSDPRWIHVGGGGKLVSIAGDVTRVWDLTRQEHVFEDAFPARPSPDGALAGLCAVSDDGKRLAYQMTSPAQIVLFNTETLRVLRRLTGGPREIQSLVFDPTRRYLAALEFETNGTFVWDLESGLPHLPALFNAHITHNWCMRFSPDGNTLALGMTTGFVYAVDMRTGVITFERKLHEGRVWDLCFSRDGQELYTAGENGALCHVKFGADDSRSPVMRKVMPMPPGSPYLPGFE